MREKTRVGRSAFMSGSTTTATTGRPSSSRPPRSSHTHTSSSNLYLYCVVDILLLMRNALLTAFLCRSAKRRSPLFNTHTKKNNNTANHSFHSTLAAFQVMSVSPPLLLLLLSRMLRSSLLSGPATGVSPFFTKISDGLLSRLVYSTSLYYFSRKVQC